MDTTSKFFVFMIILSLIIGAIVITFKPHHNLETIYKSNAQYYSHINDETVLKKLQKPRILDDKGVNQSSDTIKVKESKSEDEFAYD